MRIPSTIGRRRARIEIIPLIDIIFFLLATFVMVSLSMVQNKGIAVQLPQASSGVQQDRKETVKVTVTESGTYFLNKEPVDLNTLRIRLKSLSEGTTVFINGDGRAAFESVLSVMDLARSLGIKKVTFETRPKIEE